MFVGSFSDQIFPMWYLWWGRYAQAQGLDPYFSIYYGYPEGLLVSPFWQTSQPLFWGIFVLISKFLSPENTLNFIVLLGVLLNLVFSFLLFKKEFSKKIAFTLALLFSFSTFSFNHFTQHIDLIQLWVLPLTLYVFNNTKEKIRYYLLSSSLVVSFLLVNYFGFFLIIYFELLFIYQLVYSVVRKSGQELVRAIYLGAALTVVSIFIMAFSGFLSNSKVITQSSLRPIEDFITFSSRPWFYVLPNEKNPFFGDITKEAISKIRAQDYFLFKSYFPSEHSDAFFGFSVLLFGVVGLYLIILELYRKKELYLSWGLRVFLLVGLILISLPPFFTAFGIKVYMPSYIIYSLAPMFRVVSRANAITLLIMLYFVGYVLSKMEKKYDIRALLLVLTVLNLMSTFVPFKITAVSYEPEVFTYIRENTSVDAPIAVYPYNQTLEALYWMKVHQRPLVNPKDYYTDNFNSLEFTKKLSTETGLLEAIDRKAKFIVVFKSGDTKKIADLINSDKVVIKKEFVDSYLLKLKD